MLQEIAVEKEVTKGRGGNVSAKGRRPGCGRQAAIKSAYALCW
jgi:hypothetical protein